jgi:hypothetical protein
MPYTRNFIATEIFLIKVKSTMKIEKKKKVSPTSTPLTLHPMGFMSITITNSYSISHSTCSLKVAPTHVDIFPASLKAELVYEKNKYCGIIVSLFSIQQEQDPKTTYYTLKQFQNNTHFRMEEGWPKNQLPVQLGMNKIGVNTKAIGIPKIIYMALNFMKNKSKQESLDPPPPFCNNKIKKTAKKMEEHKFTYPDISG